MQFEPTQKTLAELLLNTSYTIPDYQRPYSWDCEGKNDQNNQINAMWEDLHNAFVESLTSEKKEGYFFGSIVVIGMERAKNFDVLDGQQRLTSLLLLLTSIKCFLSNSRDLVSVSVKVATPAVIDKFIKDIDDAVFAQGSLRDKRPEPTKKLIIQNSESFSFNYDKFLQNALECVPMPNEANYKAGVQNDKISILLASLKQAKPEQKKVALRYFNNRDYFAKQIADKYLKDGELTDDLFLSLYDFYSFVTTDVVVVRLRTEDFDSAYHVFEILNNRGLPLSNKDLFRNFMIKELIKKAGKEEKKDVETKWNDLEKNYALDTEFISRYVESTLGKKQKASAFNEIKMIFNDENTFNKNIDNFYNDIQKNLIYYTHIKDRVFDSQVINNRIYAIMQTGNEAITISLLMAIFRNTDDEETCLKYLSIYERYVLYLEIANIKRFSAPLLYDAIDKLNKGAANPMDKFLLNDEDKEDFKTALLSDFPNTKNDVARLFLARYIWQNVSSTDLLYFKLIYDKCTLEHIIPQQPAESTNWITDFEIGFREKFTYKLGNMTLLTKSKNSAANNFDWERKKNVYKDTSLDMTAEVRAQEHITVDFLEKRQEKIVATLIKALDL